jgi:predicted  nucleic acid-binding Zn-ribbon protein
MRNPNEEYDRLHDHMTAIARERDNANRIITTLEKQIEELQDEISLAHEALRRAFPENQA